MRTFDFSPLLRPSLGYNSFGRVFNELERATNTANYPSYDVIKSGDDKYEIVIATPGFDEDDIDITVTQNALTISAKSDSEDTAEDSNVEYLHKGLTSASLDYRFELSDTVKVPEIVLDGLHLRLVQNGKESNFLAVYENLRKLGEGGDAAPAILCRAPQPCARDAL